MHSSRSAPATPLDWPRLCQSLAALGAVLCLYAGERSPQQGVLRGNAPLPWQRELLGLLSAERLEPVVSLDSDGPLEGLWFLDGTGRPGFGLCLLPDSDFLAWERLLAGLPACRNAVGGWCERLLTRLARRWRGDDWRAGLRRFRFGVVAGLPVLALEPVAQVSPASAHAAHRLAQHSRVRLDSHADACCRACGRRGPLH